MGWDDEDDVPDEATVVDFDPSNRRADPRVEREIRVEYESLDEFVVAYTEDISRGGLFLVTETLLPVGSVVRLNLALPDDGPTVQIIARVAYALEAAAARTLDRRGGMGMEFLEVEGGPLANQLEAYLALHIQAGDVRPSPKFTADILLVEPDDGQRQLIAQTLRRAGHRVSTATAGMEALGLVLRVPPDLIISECELPTMDGWTLLRLVRERPSIAHIPFVLATRHDDEAARVRAYQAGADDVLVKPVAPSDVLARIGRVLGRSQSPRRLASRNALRGDLGEVALASLLSFIEIERRTGQMLVVQGEEIATLHIQDGSLIHVDLPSRGDLIGVECLFHLLDWSGGQFELTQMPVSAPRTIEMSTSMAILEHARRKDEAAR